MMIGWICAKVDKKGLCFLLQSFYQLFHAYRNIYFTDTQQQILVRLFYVLVIPSTYIFTKIVNFRVL